MALSLAATRCDRLPVRHSSAHTLMESPRALLQPAGSGQQRHGPCADAAAGLPGHPGQDQRHGGRLRAFGLLRPFRLLQGSEPGLYGQVRAIAPIASSGTRAARASAEPLQAGCVTCT
eukprot:scaffold9409_cov116-Isochrysis_galbana.AAC.2